MWYKDAEEFKTLNGYEIEKQWYPRVTKILDIKAKPGLDNFFKEVESYAKVEEVKQKSAEHGSRVHELLQKSLTGEAVEAPEDLAPALQAFEKFNQEAKIFFHPEFVERRIWSGRYRYSGTIDALAWIGGKCGVLDIKTSARFYSEYNLQTAAYFVALQEFEVKRALSLPREVETRWILRVDQRQPCRKCEAFLREKGGRSTIRNGRGNGGCADTEHEWGTAEGDVELKEFPYVHKDMRAFAAAKILWEWENDYWLRQIGYSR